MAFQITAEMQNFEPDELAAIQRVTAMFASKKDLYKWFTIHCKYICHAFTR